MKTALAPHIEAMFHEFKELFPSHRTVLDGEGFTFHDPNHMNYAALRFRGLVVWVDCYRLNRRYQERHDLVEPGSVEKVVALVADHLNCKLPLEVYA